MGNKERIRLFRVHNGGTKNMFKYLVKAEVVGERSERLFPVCIASTFCDLSPHSGSDDLNRGQSRQLSRNETETPENNSEPQILPQVWKNKGRKFIYAPEVHR